MSVVDKEFFVSLGKRLHDLRKERGITQVQLAETLGVSQQQIHSFERGMRRLPVCYLPILADLFEMSIDKLLEHRQAQTKLRKRGPKPKLQRQLEQLQQLPRTQQRLVSQMIDAFLTARKAS